MIQNFEKMCEEKISILQVLKNEIIDYYDLIKSDVDLKTQLKLILKKEKLGNNREIFMNNYKILIDKIENLLSSSLNQLNTYFSSFEFSNTFLKPNDIKEQIKSDAVKCHCVYLPTQIVNNDNNDTSLDGLGKLIVTNWYLS